MSEQLSKLIDEYKKINWETLLREDLGKYHLKEIKPHLDFVKKFIAPVVKNYNKLPPNQQSQLVNLLSSFMKNIRLIIAHSNTSQNQAVVDRIVEFKNDILETYQKLSTTLEIQAKYSSDKLSDKIDKSEIKKYQTIRKEIEEELKKLKQTRSQYAGQTIQKDVERYGNFFKTEAEKNQKKSRYCGGFLLTFSIFACVLVYFFLNVDEEIIANGFWELIVKANFINKIFVFSILFLIISVIKREYLALKHQLILNTHRHNAIDSHKEILDSIKSTENESDKEISNAILLELTKAMFNPQETGFIKDQKNTSSENKIIEVSKSIFKNSN